MPFPSTSRSWMSKKFRDSESLGKLLGRSGLIKSNKGCKIAAQNIIFFWVNFGGAEFFAIDVSHSF